MAESLQSSPTTRTFITGVDIRNTETEEPQPLSTEELIVHVERTMKDAERNAQYVDAEKARQHLEVLRKLRLDELRGELQGQHQEDIRIFFNMVTQHQANFERIWAQKTLEHKVRADELIDSLKWKHEDQQRELYEQLRRKRMPKFSVELLDLRKRQVLLAKNAKYVEAEKIKRKADLLEAIEIEKIRQQAKEENEMRFRALLKKQEWDRQALAGKLRNEKKSLLEAKAQDFVRLKKRLRNAESELRKTHVRQALEVERKLAPFFSALQLEDIYGKESSVSRTEGVSRSRTQEMPRTARTTGQPYARKVKGKGQKVSKDDLETATHRLEAALDEEKYDNTEETPYADTGASDRDAEHFESKYQNFEPEFDLSGGQDPLSPSGHSTGSGSGGGSGREQELDEKTGSSTARGHSSRGPSPYAVSISGSASSSSHSRTLPPVPGAKAAGTKLPSVKQLAAARRAQAHAQPQPPSGRRAKHGV